MKSNSKKLVRGSRCKLVVSLILLLSVISFIGYKIAKAIGTFETMKKAVGESNFCFFTPVHGDISILFPQDSLTAVMPEETFLEHNMLKLLNKHNMIRSQLLKVTIDGESLWPGHSDNQIWPLHLEWDRENRMISVESKGEKCIVNEEGAWAYGEDHYGSMHTNLIHLVMLSVWDPRDFETVLIRNDTLVRQGADGAEKSIDVKVLESYDKDTSLYFEKQSGWLVRIEAPLLRCGKFWVDMEDFAVVDKLRNIVLPTFIRARVPDDFFIASLPPHFERIIQLNIDPKNIQLKYVDHKVMVPVENSEKP